jgi:hypothetical protein
MMHRPALFLTQTAVVLLVAAVHLSALQWYLYWYYPWLDLFSHFLGGLWIALASAWLLSYVAREVTVLRLILAAMVIGVAWEVFEVFAGIPREANFAFDTSLDLTMDFIGALAGFALARYLVRDGTINAQ